MEKENNKVEQEVSEETKCAWPDCKQKVFNESALRILKKTEQGLKPTEDKAPMGFCLYHFILSANLPCGLVLGENNEAPGLYAPVEAVKLTEIVLSSLALSGNLKQIIDLKPIQTKKEEGVDDEEKSK